MKLLEKCCYFFSRLLQSLKGGSSSTTLSWTLKACLDCLEHHDAVFVVGALDETLILRGMRYHPIDIENSVLRAHKKIAEWWVAFYPHCGVDPDPNCSLDPDASLDPDPNYILNPTVDCTENCL